LYSHKNKLKRAVFFLRVRECVLYGGEDKEGKRHTHKNGKTTLRNTMKRGGKEEKQTDPNREREKIGKTYINFYRKKKDINIEKE
jgi:hypothetical protein